MIKLNCNLTGGAAAKVATVGIKSASAVATKVVEAGVLTNPVTLTAAVAVTGIYCTYKYLDNKDKRKYEYGAY